MWDMAGRCGVLGAQGRGERGKIRAERGRGLCGIWRAGAGYWERGGGEERIGGWGAERAGGTVWQDCQL